MAYQRYHHLETRIVRIFNTYGPRMRLNDGRVVPGLHLPGPARRTVDGFRRRAGRPARSPTSRTSSRGSGACSTRTSANRFNIGSQDEMTIVEFAELIRKLTGSKSEIIHKELPEDDPKTRRPDIGKARARLGWEAPDGGRRGPADGRSIISKITGISRAPDYFSSSSSMMMTNRCRQDS